MQEISIKKSLSDIQHQFYFLRSIENKHYFKSHRTAFIILAGSTLAYMLLMLFTDSRNFVTLKAVSSLLMSVNLIGWLVFFIWIGFRLLRRNSSIEEVIQTKMNEDRDYIMSFDDNHFFIRSNDFKLELDWNYFKAYLESDKAIFLFPEGSLYDAYSFTANEIGDENLKDLKRIVKGKLSPLGAILT